MIQTLRTADYTSFTRASRNLQTVRVLNALGISLVTSLYSIICVNLFRVDDSSSDVIASGGIIFSCEIKMRYDQK